MADEVIDAWLAALDERHLADFTTSEVTRALRALSSCYVERRDKLATGGPLDSAGKRAAFALFYAPLHFILTRHIVRALSAAEGVKRIIDLGCGTGSAGAAYALEAGAAIEGIDRNAWAVKEAEWTYRQLGLSGRAAVATMQRVKVRGERGLAVLASYAVNELPEVDRDALRAQLLAAHAAGSRVLIIEPIARRANRWWDGWKEAVEAAGGREDEWRFQIPLPPRQRLLAKGAGLDPRELTARTLYLTQA
jgi:predicted RNA methylase